MTIARSTSPAVTRLIRRCGFTLIELLVVMGIIVLLIALALPAFRFITGSRSVESASNQVAAALSIARAQAIGVQEVRGVAIYRDPENDRSVATLIEVRNAPFPAWTAATTATGDLAYSRGQYYTDSGDVYVCTESYVDPAGGGTIAPSSSPGYWTIMPSMKTFAGANAVGTFVELQSGADFIQLPVGVDARGVGNEIHYPNPASTSTDPTYRYFNPAIVLFDANGLITTAPYFISREGLLGSPIERVGNFFPAPRTGTLPTVYYYGAANPVGTPTATATVTSQIGLVLFDAEIFKNATTVSGVNPQFWLDQNATPLMINRYNGTLVKGD